MAATMKPTRHYLTDNRLEGVIYLIQYLGLRKDNSLAADNESVIKPKSAKNWELLCREHPEFFNVTKRGSVSLSVRDDTKQPVELSVVQELIKTAMEIHERQFKVDCDEKKPRLLARRGSP